MTLHDIGPDFVQINYHSDMGLHSMSHSVLAWLDADSPGGQGQFTTHAAGNTDAVGMVEGLVTVLLGDFGANVTFDNWVIFHKDSPTGPAFPKAGANFVDMVGTVATPGWYKAVQHTYNFRDTEFFTAKVVCLDAASQGDFSKVSTAAGLAASLLAVLSDVDLGWCSRAGNRISTFASLTKDLNDRLRGTYRLG